MMLVFLIALFLVLCVLKVPIPFSLALSSLVMLFILDLSTQQLVIQLYKGLGLFPLLAVPFFLLVGNLMNFAKITDDLVTLSQAIVGRIRGGLAHVNVFVSMVFGGISGSSTADTSAVGAVLIPSMKKDGYSSAFSAAITCASSTMGNIIPPSLYMIIYGSMAGVSIEKLFMAGIIPGILIGVTQMIYSYYYARKNDIPKAEKIELPRAIRIFGRTFPALILIVLVIGGITFGFFTATEASVVAVLYTLLLALFYYRTIRPKQLPGIFYDTAVSYGAILFTIASASIFSWLIAYMDGPEIVAGWIESVSTNPIVLLLIISGILLIVGTFMSEIATIIIFTPIFLQIQELGGIDPIHMGIVVVMMLCLGLVTPPYGVCLLIAAKISGDRMLTVTKELIPLILIFLLVVFLIIVFPEIALFIPNTLAR